jgi:hypothetical protein
MKSYKELNESLADDLMKMKGAKARGSVADQKAARDALMAKRKETNPNPPALGTSSDKYKLGGYDKKSNRSYSEEVESLDEKSDQAKQNKTQKNKMDASRGDKWKHDNNALGDAVRNWDGKHPSRQSQNTAIGRALRQEEVELEEALTARDKKDIEAIKGAIKRLQNELTNPNSNLDRNNINQRIATEKKRLGLYGIKEEVELEEAHKIGSKVTIHKGTGTGIVGHIGEISRKHKGDTNPSYTIFHGDNQAIRANKSQIKAVKESVEQIDELSKKTLGSYVKRATNDVSLGGGMMSRSHYEPNNDKHQKQKIFAQGANLVSKRKTGIAKAVDKLTKESIELDEKLDPSMSAGKYIKDFKKSDAPQFKGKSPEKRRIMGVAAFLDAQRKIKEEVELKEARKEPAQVYHPTYSSAVQHARANAEKQGYTVSDDDWFHHVNSGPGKPSGGKTTRHVIPLQKDGKPSKKALAIQVHDRQTDKNSYELNSYIN